MGAVNARETSVVILGGGPGGYEAALVAAHLGARVTVVDRDGLGGAAVLTDCVPSKALISTADFMSEFETAADLGVHLEDDEGDEVSDCRRRARAPSTRRVLRPRRRPEPRHRGAGSRLTACACCAAWGAWSSASSGAGRARRRRGRGAPRRRRARRHRRDARGSWPRRSPTASASSRGSRSTTCTSCPSSSSSSAPASPAPSWPRPTSAWAPRSSWSPRATGCCPARTPTPPRSSRTSSASAAWRCSTARAWPPSSAPQTGVARPARGRPRGRGLARPAGRRLRAADQRASGLEEVGVAARGLGPRLGRPGLAHVGARRVCRGRLHRRAAPGVRGGDAGTHRDVRTPSATPWRR